jgi:hypothetical protein
MAGICNPAIGSTISIREGVIELFTKLLPGFA